MTHALQTRTLPKCPNTGLTLPLSRSLDSRGLAQHRATVAVELEVLSKKTDRFGWERDRGSAAHDRLIVDWMDALQDYPLDEIRAACREAIKANPNKMPNEGHIVAEIINARKRAVAFRPRPVEPPRPEVTKEDLERRARLAAELLGSVKRMGETE